MRDDLIVRATSRVLRVGVLTCEESDAEAEGKRKDLSVHFHHLELVMRVVKYSAGIAQNRLTHRHGAANAALRRICG